jgi:hypothetical protein
MTVDRWRKIAWAAAGVAAIAVLLSLIWRVPYLYTLIGAAAWAFVGHIITADDDTQGGWSNPDGSIPFPWREIVVKASLLAFLVAIAVLFPGARALGG